MKPKQEQIKEMANAVVRSAVASKAKIDDKVAINLNEFVKNLYNLGYRKASEVIDEFVERLKAKESPKLLAWEYGEGYLDCIKTAEQLADEIRKEVKNG